MLSLRVRLTLFPALVVLALAVAAAAGAKQTSVRVVQPALPPHAGVPWTVTVQVALRGKPYARAGWRPTLYVVDHSGMPVATFRGRAAAPGTYRVAIVFPRGGTWRYVIPDPVTGEWSFGGLRVLGH